MQFDFYSSQNLTLKVDKDGSICYLKINSDNTYNAISEKELLELLDKAGIVYGFENAKHKRKLTSGFIEIAIADPPDNFFEPKFLFDIPLVKTIDLDSINKLPFIKKDTIVGSMIPAQTEHTALNIFGKPHIKYARTKLLADDNFIIKNDEIIAVNSGYIYKNHNGKLCLLTEFEEENDIFKKKISLKIRLILKKDILVSEISSSEDIRILGIVRDCPKIYSEKDIYLNSAIDSKIIAWGDIVFTGKITDCKMIANNDIIGIENSRIDSGSFVSGKSIDIYDAYKKSDTSLEVALAPVEKELLISKKEKNATGFSTYKKLLNNIEKKFYNFDSSSDENYIKINNILKSNIYLRIYNRSLQNKKERKNFIFS